MEKSKLMMIIIIALLVVLLGTIVGVSFYVMGLVKNQQTAAVSEDDPVAVDSSQIVKQLTEEQKTRVTLSPITTNLAKSADGSSHIAKIGIGIVYDNSVKKESEAFTALIGKTENQDYARSIALACIYSSTYEELDEPDGMDNLANTIKEKLQDEFNTTLIVEVYIIDRTLQ